MKYTVVLYDITAGEEVVIGESDILVGYDELAEKIIVLRLSKTRG
jgi:hypothetical protein